MKSFIPQRLALNGSAALLTLFVIFHLLILSRVVPFGAVWGGRLKTASEMIVFETLSIVMTLFMLAIVAVAGGYLKAKLNPIVLKGILWSVSVLFLLNTIGNLLSTSRLEQVMFAPITLMLSIFFARMACIKGVI